MKYVDGFLLVVPTKKLPEYKAIARKAGRVWRELGALQYVECAGDDLAGELGMPFGKRVAHKRSETIVFSFIVYSSRAHRDRVNKKVMADKRMQAMCKAPMPFDLKKMSYGGFRVLVDA
ncbi:MAG TPA: DUF1428 domain-containing protein [Planctomycetota bacterium]|nr:DUF1428 domain-containing protein [Planctomycetota bacterium]